MDDVIEIVLDILGDVAEALITSKKTPSWLRKLLLIALGALLVIVIAALICVALRPGSLPLRIVTGLLAAVMTCACGIRLHHLLSKQQDHN